MPGMAPRRSRHPDRVRRRLRRHPAGVPARRSAGRVARPGPLAIASCDCPRHPNPARTGARPNTAPSSRWPTRPPGPNPTTPPPPTPPATAPPATGWDRLHPRLTHRAAWLDHDGELPIIEGTLIRLQVERLPGDRDPKPVWLWSSRTGATTGRRGPAAGRRSCAASTSNTPSGSSNKPWAGPPRSPHHRSSRPLDLAHHRRPHPTRLARPLTADHRRPWETTRHPTGPAHSRPRPTRVSQHPPDNQPPGQRTKTLHTPAPDAHPVSKTSTSNPPPHRQARKSPNQLRQTGLNQLNCTAFAY